MTRYGLTAEQGKMLAFIERAIADTGVPPSYQEMVDGLGLISKATVHRRLRSLRDRGHVDFLPGKTRSLRLIAAGGPAAALPPALHRRLEAFCAGTGDTLDDVIFDAVTLHLNALESSPPPCGEGPACAKPKRLRFGEGRSGVAS